MLFFYDEVKAFNKSYAGLFGIGDEDTDEKDKEQGSEDEDEGGADEDSGAAGFFGKWNWFYSTDIVSDTLRISWDEVLQKSIVEYLNILAYRKDRNNWEKNSIKNSTRK